MIIDFSLFGWPQWTVIIVMLIELIGTRLLHGRPRRNYNIGSVIFDCAGLLTILIFGGFFS